MNIKTKAFRLKDVRFFGEGEFVQRGGSFEHRGETWTYLADGLTRAVFVNEKKTQVIKVPNRTRFGRSFAVLANLVEDAVYNRLLDGKEKQEYAKCELIEHGWVLMEYVICPRGIQGKAKGKAANGRYKYLDYGDYGEFEERLKEVDFDEGEYDDIA